jgi:hypothetical protein
MLESLTNGGHHVRGGTNGRSRRAMRDNLMRAGPRLLIEAVNGRGTACRSHLGVKENPLEPGPPAKGTGRRGATHRRQSR